jgi:hypothetical protein
MAELGRRDRALELGPDHLGHLAQQHLHAARKASLRRRPPLPCLRRRR